MIKKQKIFISERLFIARMIFLSFLLTLSSCGFVQSYRVKGHAKDQAISDFKKRLIKEFEQTLSQDFPRKNDYVEFVIGRTDLQMEEIKELSKDHYSVSIKIITIPESTRITLLEILKPIRGRTINAFNFSDALMLIHQQNPDLKLESSHELSLEISL